MAEFIVTTLEDESEENGTLSLREAIALANASGYGGYDLINGVFEDTITFADGLEGTIQLTDGQIRSIGNLVIDGDGRITISGDVNGDDIFGANGITDVAASLAAGLMADNEQIFRHDNGELTFDGVTLTGGSTLGGGGAVGAFADAGEEVMVTFIDTTVAGNYSRFDGGGAYVEGDIVVEGSTFSNNVSGDDGGALAARFNIDIVDSQISGNEGADYGGGAFSFLSDITVTDSEITGNQAERGGGIYTRNGSVTITNAVIANNTAEGNGGGVYSDETVTVTDSTIEGNQGLKGGGIYSGDVTITGTTIAGNTGGIGGGVYAREDFTAADSVIRDNNATASGGVESGGSVDIDRSTFSGNTAQVNGALFTNNGGEIDGSVFVDNDGGAGAGAVVNSGTLTVTGSTFTGNTGGDAGAINDLGVALTVVNSTFVDNSSDENAGAISSRNGPVLDHVTITRNTSGENAGAVNVDGGTITNSIITSNIGGGQAGPDLTVQGGYTPNSGSITFTGVSIVGEDDTAFGPEGAPYNVINGAAEDIFVSEVEDNGGPVPTLALLANATNIALDATNFISETTNARDARGGPRTRDVDGVDNGGVVDLGAFELNAVNLNGVGLNEGGEFGAEEIFGTDDDDTISGGPSFEDSVAGSGQDTILGFGGDDLLDGEGGADSIEGGAGDDTIIGGPSNSEDRVDTIFGGDGDDDINGGFFIDQIFGGAGDDTIRVIGDDDIDDVDGGDDIDTLDLTTTGAANGYTVDLERGDFLQLRFEGESLVVREGSITNVENVIGGAGNDLFNGDDQANRLEGGAGDDTLLGQGGGDLLEGGDGADLIEGGDGDDTLIGGGASDLDGVDTLSGGDGDDVFDGGFLTDEIFGGAGDDTVLINENDFADNIDGGDDIDTVDFSGADADIAFEANLATGTIVRAQTGRVPNDSGGLVNVENLIGGALGDKFTGDDEANQLEGGGGDDSLSGAGGDDTLLGGGENDTLSGGEGVNTVDGGDGQDVAELSGALGDYIVLAAPDGGRILVREIDGVIVEVTTFSNVETFRFADQDVALADLKVGPLVVTTLEDENDTGSVTAAFGGGGLSLREALALAQEADEPVTITFAEDLEGTIRLVESTLQSRGDVTIEGDARIVITGDRDGNDFTDDDGITDVTATRDAAGDLDDDNVQVFRHEEGDLTLKGLTLTGGTTSDGGGAIGFFERENEITIENSLLAGNFSRFDGGGLYASGNITVRNSVFSNNVSGDDGGAISSRVNIDLIDSSITENQASDQGGGVHTRTGKVTITGGEVSNNTSFDFYDRNGVNEGGAVFADEAIRVTNAVISGNSADVTGGLHSDFGANVTITGTTVANNTATEGGAGGVYSFGEFNATDSVIIGNAGEIGGVIATGAVIVDSTLFQNNVGSNVGAIFQTEGVLFEPDEGTAAANSTFVGNKGGAGAGVIDTLGDLTLDQVTITGNTSGANGAAIEIASGDGVAKVTNSIITGNTGGPGASSEINTEGGAITFVGANIVGANAAAFNAGFENVQNGDPAAIFAAAVAENGGLVPTLALLATGDNPALDASAVVTQTTDSRGEDRPVDLSGVDNGGAVDLGAFELRADEDQAPPVITSDLTLTINEGESSALALTPVTASDATQVTFAISGGPDADRVAIDPATGVLSLPNEPDFENPEDANGDNAFEVLIKVTDANGSAVESTLTITVANVNDFPVITSGVAFTAAENQTIAGAVTASDDQAGVTFSITGGADADLFTINTANGVLQFKTAPNFEAPTDVGADNIYDVHVSVTDSDGLTDTQAALVAVLDINDAPIAAPATINGDEDTAIVGTLTASDDDSDVLTFSLNSGPTNGATTVNDNGDFTFLPDPDFNGTDSFSFRVTDGELADVETVTITVNPVDEPVDPGDPAAPDDPADPGDPADPDVPADQDDPADVVDPADPDDPADPGDPADLDDPADPGEPADPGVPADPGDPFDPAAPPAAPTGPTQGDDTLFGTAQNDTINALAGDDLVNGLNGDDFLIGGQGEDKVRGAAGDDTIRGNAGEDTLLGNGGEDDIRGNSGADKIRGGGASDTLRGNGGADDIRGNGGADVIRGGGGQDTVKGGGGADNIKGGGGADLLEGGGGQDILAGQGGNDTLRGGAGADTFQFRASDRNDTILDFVQGQDKIEILSGARSFEALDIVQDGLDVLIGFGTGQVRVVTDRADAFDEGDFIF